MPTTKASTPLPTTGKPDDPKTSPYPIWNPRRGYRQGQKVTWHQAVYAANYFTQGSTPDKPLNGNQPWLLLGPVLHGDQPAN
jgi:chitinase